MLNNTAEIFSKPETHQDTSLIERLRLSYSPGPSTWFVVVVVVVLFCFVFSGNPPFHSLQGRAPPGIPPTPSPRTAAAALTSRQGRLRRAPPAHTALFRRTAAPRARSPALPSPGAAAGGRPGTHPRAPRAPATVALLTRQIRRCVLTRQDRLFYLWERARASQCAEVAAVSWAEQNTDRTSQPRDRWR